MMPWCIFGVYVPGLSGRLLGRRNLVLGAVVVGGFSCASSPFSFLAVGVDTTSVGTVRSPDDGGDCVALLDTTSMCSGDVADVLVSCIGRVMISALGMRFSKLKCRTSPASFLDDARAIGFIGLKLSAIREKLKVFLLPAAGGSAADDFADTANACD